MSSHHPERVAIDSDDEESLSSPPPTEEEEEHSRKQNNGNNRKKKKADDGYDDVSKMIYSHSMSETLILWLLTNGKDAPNMSVLIDRYLRLLVQKMNIPVHRSHISYLLNHPQAGARFWKWFGPGRMTSFYHPRSFIDRRFEFAAHDSPFILLELGAPYVRVRASDATVSDDIAWFRKEGYTDYLALVDLNRDGEYQGAFSWATQHPQGFCDEHIHFFHKTLPALTVIARIHISNIVTKRLLQTYLGHDPGRRVAAGMIQRGQGISMRSVIWFSDVRDFTKLSDKYGRIIALNVINTVFELTEQVMTKHKGEILKFMGDGCMSIFPEQQNQSLDSTSKQEHHLLSSNDSDNLDDNDNDSSNNSSVNTLSGSNPSLGSSSSSEHAQQHGSTTQSVKRRNSTTFFDFTNLEMLQQELAAAADHTDKNERDDSAGFTSLETMVGMDPTRRARAAAVELQQLIQAACRDRKAQGLPHISVGIGLHYGTCSYGNVGGESRLDFTVIGPAVNLASRVESLCGKLDASILATAEFVHLDVEAEEGGWQSCGQHAVKGVAQPVDVYQLKQQQQQTETEVEEPT
ncbi:Photoactivated adenylate cyclase subunit alpha [Seminavis robusta]|uniref:Photoactivated adenylate cyclase subunit alpha n=1 Tax=Seminavis robusta TaxID=568900 RepID=A0A9N8H481_9STRA|nr:Photoactivated adenylate cyclase subunit alpha [Seminavis robusta]|eukprot:Sro55_g032530.1 Photoactivated adenylate cyclase subunit alpha (575) ;mRNA; r:139030-140754